MSDGDGRDGKQEPVFAPESLRCASPERNRVLGSSRDVGWSSLLLDHLEGRGVAEAYDKPSTRDFCITVPVSGMHDLSILRHGRWQSAVAQPGGVSLTRGGESNRLRWQTRDAHPVFTVANAYLAGTFLEEAAEHFRRPGQATSAEPTCSLLTTDRVIASAVGAMLSAIHRQAGDAYAESAARFLAAHLIWMHGGRYDPAADRRSPGIISDARLARVVEFMTINFRRHLSVAELAGVAGVSPFHFNRLFQRATGQTPQRFLADHRMRNARRLLATTSLSIAEIAAASGYVRATAFTAAFTRCVGISPSRYRVDQLRKASTTF